VLPLDSYLDQPAAYMQVTGSATGHRTPVQQQLVDLLGQGGLPADKVEAVERFAFYERVSAASLIVQTGEATAYGNAMFAKGVILN
jgi:L-fucose mutarotase